MSTGSLLFLILRPVHVLLAATWLGSAVFISLMLMPTIESSGPSGGAVMLGLNRKGLVPFFASLAGLTVLTGIYLFWRFTGGFDPEISRSHAGMAFGIARRRRNPRRHHRRQRRRPIVEETCDIVRRTSRPCRMAPRNWR